jgi:hypothetical protein
MGERSLANCFARCFYVSETRGFEKWREWVRFEKHKEAIIKRTINHWKKHIFNFARAAMKNWVQQTKIHQTTMALEHTAMLAEEADTLNKFKANLHADKVKTLNDAKDQHAGTTEVYNQRL